MTRRALLLALVLAVPLLAGERREKLLTPEEAGYAPYLRYAPRGGAGRLDWLLVTPRELAPAFAPLVRHRRDLGLAADVVALEDVAGDVLLGGGDLPERLRNFVRYLHRRYGLTWLVLGGDSDVVPPRMIPMGMRGPSVHYGEPFAGEAYFGCLDGEWNADADARFGEAEAGDDDGVDLEPEVHVGRIPVENAREAETFVAKLLRYERPEKLDYQDRVAYLGGRVFSDDDAFLHYTRVQEELFGPKGFVPSFFTRKREGTSVADVMKALTAGVGIVCHYHHSFTYNLGLPSGAIDTGNFTAVANLERPFVFFSNGCYSNQFTKEGISEKLLLSDTGGAAAFIGSTNTCFSSSLGLERRFWEEVLGRSSPTIGEALSRMRADSAAPGYGAITFLRLSLNLLGDPATRVWTGRPVRPEFTVKRGKDGTLEVALRGELPGWVLAACVQDGPLGAVRGTERFVGSKGAVTFPPAIGNGTPLRVTVFGERTVPTTEEVRDPVRVRATSLRVADGRVVVGLAGAEEPEVAFDLPASPEPGPLVLTREVGGVPLRVAVPVLDGADRGFVRGDETVLVPGFSRLGIRPDDGIPVVVSGEPEIVTPAGSGGPAPDGLEVESTDAKVRVTWDGAPGARWLVEGEGAAGRRLLTPVPLRNPVFELLGLPPLSEHPLVVSRLGGGEARITARTSFPFQRGFPQRIDANVTSVQILDLDGRRGNEMLFGDDAKGLWALHADGSEVRHAGDSWTFGLFAAIEGGVFEPVVADLVGSRRPEILATGKLKDRKLHAFTRDGKPLPGFPVAIPGRLMTPPLVGDFDGKRGKEVLVVSGFGKTVELVRPDGKRSLYAEIGQYNYAYPIAVNLDRDRALEVVILDGAGRLHALDQGGKEMKGFPVDLGGPGRCTPMVADLDRDRRLEIVAVGKGTTRIAVVDADGTVQADLAIPGAGKPANNSFFYPGLADLGGKGRLSIVLGTPSKQLFALDLEDGEKLTVREGFPISFPAEVRGVAAVDVDADGRDELFLSLHDGEVRGLRPDGTELPGFPLRTKADTYAVPLLEDLDGDRDLELCLGAADGVLRVWDLPYRVGKRAPTWRGLLAGPGMPGVPGEGKR